MLDYRYARWKPEQFALRNGYLAEYITAQILKDHWYKGQQALAEFRNRISRLVTDTTRIIHLGSALAWQVSIG